LSEASVARSSKARKTQSHKDDSKPEAVTAPAKYLFIDIVGFTHERSVEAQSDIIGMLNKLVRGSLSYFKIAEKVTVLLPTGDGMCIALLNVDTPYDIHMLIALEILRRIEKGNEATKDQMRRFEVRIGINANTDNVVVDINGKRNLAGSGINIAQRVMSTGDGGQIMVSQVVYETLSSREKYMGNFRPYSTTVKHGVELPVYQFAGSGHLGLNTRTPIAFQGNNGHSTVKLTQEAAHYLAHAIRLRKFILEHSDGDSVTALMLWLLAEDSVEKDSATEMDPHKSYMFKRGTATLDEMFEYYGKIDWYVLLRFRRFVREQLEPYEDCFDYSMRNDIHFVSEAGRKKLESEFPEIWQGLKLSQVAVPVGTDSADLGTSKL